MKLIGPGVFIGLTLAAVLGAELAIETLLRQHELRREHEHTLADLNLVRARIEMLVYRDLYAVRALATHIASLPDLDQQDFEAYVKPLMQEPSTLRTLAAAPDLVIRYLYPLAGNESVLGTDYRQLPSQRDDVERAIASRTLVINGPTPLIQGGDGFIAREAVYLQTEGGPPTLWGVVSAVVDRDMLYRVSGLRELGQRMELAIRAVDIADQVPAKVTMANWPAPKLCCAGSSPSEARWRLANLFPSLNRPASWWTSAPGLWVTPAAVLLPGASVGACRASRSTSRAASYGAVLMVTSCGVCWTRLAFRPIAWCSR